LRKTRRGFGKRAEKEKKTPLSSTALVKEHGVLRRCARRTGPEATWEVIDREVPGNGRGDAGRESKEGQHAHALALGNRRLAQNADHPPARHPDGAREHREGILLVSLQAIGKIRVTGGDCAP
jgi:hypothetical protein